MDRALSGRMATETVDVFHPDNEAFWTLLDETRAGMIPSVAEEYSADDFIEHIAYMAKRPLHRRKWLIRLADRLAYLEG